MVERSAFSMGRRVLAHLSVARVEAATDALATHRLLVAFDLNFEAATKVHSFHADLYIDGPGGSRLYVTTLAATRPWTPVEIEDAGSLGRSWTFAGSVASEQLDAMDQARASGPAFLRFHLWMLTEDGARLTTTETWVQHRMAVSDWLDLVRALGGCDYVLLAIPSPRAPAPAALARALRELRRARDELSAGRRPVEIAKFLRAAVDALTEFEGDKTLVDKLGGRLDVTGPDGVGGGLRDLGLTDRLRLVRFALGALIAPSGHGDDRSAAVVYDLPSARAALVIALALASLCAGEREG